MTKHAAEAREVFMDQPAMSLNELKEQTQRNQRWLEAVRPDSTAKPTA